MPVLQSASTAVLSAAAHVAVLVAAAVVAHLAAGRGIVVTARRRGGCCASCRPAHTREPRRTADTSGGYASQALAEYDVRSGAACSRSIVSAEDPASCEQDAPGCDASRHDSWATPVVCRLVRVRVPIVLELAVGVVQRLPAIVIKVMMPKGAIQLRGRLSLLPRFTPSGTSYTALSAEQQDGPDDLWAGLDGTTHAPWCTHRTHAWPKMGTCEQPSMHMGACQPAEERLESLAMGAARRGRLCAGCRSFLCVS